MDRDATLGIKRAGIVLAAAVGAFGCGGGSLPSHGPGGSGGTGTGGAACSAVCCTGTALSVTSVVHARGFTAYEGRPVKAVFFYSGLPNPHEFMTRETSVSGGAFDVAFPPD